MKLQKILLVTTILVCLTYCVANGQTYTLEEYEKFALENSKSMEIAKERINVATNLRKSAFTQFLPNIQAVGTYLWNQKDISMIAEDALLPVGSKMDDGSFGFTPDQIKNGWTLVDGQPVPLDANGVPFNPKTNPEKILWKNYALLPKDALTFDIKNIFVGGIGVTQPIFMGFKVRELYNITKSSERISKIAYDNEKTELIISVDQAYWTVVSLINKKNLATKYVELLQTLLNNVEKSAKEGVATKGDILNIKVKLNEAQVALTKATNGVELAKMALFRLCGLDINGAFSLADEDIDTPDNLLIDNAEGAIDINSALSQRGEINELYELSKISHSQVNIARSRFMPNIAATANYLTTNPNVFNGFSKKFKGTFSVGVAITIPIFHFGDRIYTLKAAKSEERIVGKRIEQVKELITLQIRQSEFKYREAKNKLVAAISNIEAAQENLKLAELSYKEGLISLTDLLAAQTAYISANSEKIDANIDLRMCELHLRKAIGEKLY